MTSHSRGGGGVTQSVTNSTDRLRECMTGRGVKKPKNLRDIIMDGLKTKHMKHLTQADVERCMSRRLVRNKKGFMISVEPIQMKLH